MSVYRHPDWKEFLARFRENPADNLVRLVAADWLDERGEGDRATLFRVQVELDGFGPVPDSECCATSQSPSHWCAYQAWHEKHPRAHGLLRWACELAEKVAPEGFIGITEPDEWTAASGNRYALYERGVLSRLGGNEGELFNKDYLRNALAEEIPELVSLTDRWPSEWASGLSEDGREWAWERDMSGEDGPPNYIYLGPSPYTPDVAGDRHRLPPAVFDRMATKYGIFTDARFGTSEEAVVAASAAIIEEYAT